MSRYIKINNIRINLDIISGYSSEEDDFNNGTFYIKFITPEKDEWIKFDSKKERDQVLEKIDEILSIKSL